MSETNPVNGGEILSPELIHQIKALCDEYRAALPIKGTASFEPLVERIARMGRVRLLNDLCRLAVEHLRSHGVANVAGVLLAANPNLQDELPPILQELESLALTEMFISRPTNEPVRPPTPRRKPARGLHIRCPHCSNPVELVADTPYDVISCETCGSNFNLLDRSEATRSATALKKIGRFELISRLGVGGFGTVWKARDTELDRVVAVKIPRRGQLSVQETEQFFREARAAAQLRHTNIVPVHEVGHDEDSIFIVSDLIRGVALSDWLTAGKPSFRETAELIATIADALHHAHQNGVIHRDLKPSNIMMDDDGLPHLMDFGLAKRDVDEIAMTADGQIIGTPAYMSPEQAGGQSQWVDRRTDVYSLGVMLFEMLTGELPFRGNAQMQLHQRLNEDAPNAQTLNRHIPRDLATICAKCLEREPIRRYGTAKEVADELRRHLNHVPIHARPLSRPSRFIRWTKRNPLLATVAAMIVFLAIAGPMVAVVIAGQRNRLADLVAEKNNVIATSQQEIDRYVAENTTLKREVRIEAGQESAWQIWREARKKTPRQMLIADLAKHSEQYLNGEMDNLSLAPLDKIRALLALAVMKDSENKNDESAALRRRAIGLLKEQFSNDRRSTGSVDDALAQTIEDYSMVARLEKADEDQLLEELRALRQRAALAWPNDLQRQIAWFESEMRSSAAVTQGKRLERLAAAEKIKKSLASQWPNDVADIYRLACFLAEKACLLADAKSGSAGADSQQAKGSSD